VSNDDLLCTDDLLAVAARIKRRDVSPVEVVDAMLARIERLDPALRSFVTVCDGAAREAAQAAEAESVPRISDPVDRPPS